MTDILETGDLVRVPADDALTHPVEPTQPVTNPLVAAPAEPDRGASEDIGVIHGFVVGTIIGTIATFIVCGGIGLAAGTGLGPAVGIGAFAAFWGGPGFGGMMGAVLHHERSSTNPDRR